MLHSSMSWTPPTSIGHRASHPSRMRPRSEPREPTHLSQTHAAAPTFRTCKSFIGNTCGPSRMCWALLTSSVNGPMPQAVNVVGQTEQQGLADLGSQTAPGGARGELAFDGREHAFDLGALPIRFFRKS